MAVIRFPGERRDGGLIDFAKMLDLTPEQKKEFCESMNIPEWGNHDTLAPHQRESIARMHRLGWECLSYERNGAFSFGYPLRKFKLVTDEDYG